MKVGQLFEAFDRSFDYKRISPRGTTKFYFTDNGIEYYTEVDHQPMSLWNVIALKRAIDNFNNQEELKDYLQQSDIKVFKIAFETFTREDHEPVDESNNFNVETVTAIMGTISNIIQDAMKQSSNVYGVYYEPTTISRARINEKVFRKFQRNSSERYELLEPKKNLFLLLDEDIIDEMLDIGDPKGFSKGQMSDPAAVMRDILEV